MITISQLLEASSKTIVLAFGRLNPVTSGHAVLANAVVALSKKYKADHVFYVSRSQDPKKNPLNVDQKVYYARQAFKGLNIVGASDQVRTFIEAAKMMSGKYENLIMVAGSDRVLEFKTLLDKYNGKEFNFKSILVVSAGERDPDADGATGMSASKMRQAAAENNFPKFKLGCPPNMNATVCRKMFDDVRAGMRISESSIDSVREDYISERIFNVGDIVEFRGKELTVQFRGSNYVILETNEKVWLNDIKPTEKVNESMVVKQQDKLKAARIIAMALGYEDAETKNDPSTIVNMSLRTIRNKPLNTEAKNILSRMLDLARKLEIPFDEKIIKEDEERADYKITKNGRKYHRQVKVGDKEQVQELSDNTLKSYASKAVNDTLTGKKDRNSGLKKVYARLAGTNKPLVDEKVEDAHTDDKEKEDHNLMINQGKASSTSYERLRKIHKKILEDEEHKEEHFTEEELEAIADLLSEDDYLEEGYDEGELIVVDEETGEEIIDEQLDQISEVLSRVERLRAKVRMVRSQAKRERGAKIALNRRSSTAVLGKRARRLAIKALKLKFAKKPLNTLSVAEKERLEARISRLKPVITRLATKIMPKVRNLEKERLS